MTLKSVSVANYQSHRKTVLQLHTGVNVLIGVSDAGKSAFLRGLIWPIRNNNEDRGFRSIWGGLTDVELTFDDGKQISRTQDKANNYYLYDPVANVDNEYKAFKTVIPEDIVKALNMSEINIQGQFSSPFLLSDTPGDVAKLINKVADLSDIDKSVSAIASLIRANNKDIAVTESIIADLTTDYAKFAYLEQMEKDVLQYEKLCDENNQIDIQIRCLDNLTVEIVDKQKDLAEIEAFLKAEPDLVKGLALVEEEKAVTGQVRAIETLIWRVQADTDKLHITESRIKAEPELNSTLELVDQLNKIQKEGSALQELIKQITVQQIRVDSDVICIKQLEADFKRSFPALCPLCNRGDK